MINFFENLKDKILTYFKARKIPNEEQVRERRPTYENQNCEESDPLNKGMLYGEESSISIYNDDKKNLRMAQEQGMEEFNQKCQIINLSFVPRMYIVLSVSTILLMFILSRNAKLDLSFYSEVCLNGVLIMNYFELPRINGLVFYIINSLVSLFGILMITSIYLVMKNLDPNNYKMTVFKRLGLYSLFFFGMISNLVQFFSGLFSLISYEKKYEGITFFSDFFSFYETLFIIQILFNVLFGLMCILLKTTFRSDGNKYYSWFDFKVITIFYILVFTLIFVFMKLYNKKKILSTLNIEFLNGNSLFIIGVFPYFIYFMNSMFYFLFYDDVKSIHLSMNTNFNLEKFDRYQKNIL